MKPQMMIRKNRTVGAAVLTACLLAGPAGAAGTAAPAPAPQTASEKKIDDQASLPVAEARKLMAEHKDLQLIDVRAPQEFAQGYLEGSQNIPFIDLMEGRHALPKDKPLLLICSIGGRSFAAVQLLQEKGYTQVYNLDGGIQAWRRASLPVTTPH